MRQVLERHFGFPGFRPGQREVVEAVLAGRDVLAQMPTGGGKSLCYQLPALVLPGVTLVVSPLIALMKDQADGMRERGLSGIHEISAHRSPEENRRSLEAVADGTARVVFVSPERFSIPGFLEAVRQAEVSLFAVDEAHCITQWGHDFRPDYLRLGEAVEALRPRSVLALTATATPAVRQHVVRRLGMRDPHVFVAPLDRENLFLEVKEAHQQSKESLLVSKLGQRGSKPAIVYVGRRKDAETIAKRLVEVHEISAAPYHAGFSAATRARVHEAFMAGQTSVIVATVAFGMGIDKADVRTVVHWQHPASLESYFQEAGRAGRDGGPARCLLIWSQADLASRRMFARRRYPDFEPLDALHRALAACPPEQARRQFRTWSPECWKMSLGALLGRGFDPAAVPARRTSARAAWLYLEGLRRAEQERLDEMERYLMSQGCRRRVLLGYFGEEAPDWCGQCDQCLPRSPLQRPR